MNASKNEFPTAIQNYIIKVAEGNGAPTDPLCQMSEKAFTALARQSRAMKNWLDALRAKKPSGELAAEVYIATQQGFKTFEECEKIAAEALKECR